MLKRILVPEDGRVPAKKARDWKIQGQKKRITRKECERLLNDFEMGGFKAQKGLWNLAREKCCRTEEHCLRKKVTLLENIRRCSWLRDDGEDKKESKMEVDKETKGETGKKMIREEEKEENETVVVKRRC